MEWQVDGSITRESITIRRRRKSQTSRTVQRDIVRVSQQPPRHRVWLGFKGNSSFSRTHCSLSVLVNSVHFPTIRPQRRSFKCSTDRKTTWPIERVLHAKWRVFGDSPLLDSKSPSMAETMDASLVSGTLVRLLSDQYLWSIQRAEPTRSDLPFGEYRKGLIMLRKLLVLLLLLCLHNLTLFAQLHSNCERCEATSSIRNGLELAIPVPVQLRTMRPIAGHDMAVIF